MRTTRHAAAAAILTLTATATLAGEAKIAVGHGSFQPAEVTIQTGQAVTFTNTKEMPGGHTVVFDELDTASEGLAKGKSWSHTFEQPGTYHFHVKEHADGATGTVTVE